MRTLLNQMFSGGDHRLHLRVAGFPSVNYCLRGRPGNVFPTCAGGNLSTSESKNYLGGSDWGIQALAEKLIRDGWPAHRGLEAG